MKTGAVLWGLLALNVVLLGLLLMQDERHHLAFGQATRHPDDYLMVPGEVSGAPTEIIYIIDTTEGLLGAVTYDDASQTLQVMPAINLNNLEQAGVAGKLH